MNFYNHFRETWTSRFPNEDTVPELDCLKADQFSSVLDQKSALERTEKEVDDQLEEIKVRYHRKLFLHDYIRKCINKLSAISRVFDDFDGAPGSSVPPITPNSHIPPSAPPLIPGTTAASIYAAASHTSTVPDTVALPAMTSRLAGGFLPAVSGAIINPTLANHSNLSAGEPPLAHAIHPDAIKMESELDFSHMIPVENTLLRPQLSFFSASNVASAVTNSCTISQQHQQISIGQPAYQQQSQQPQQKSNNLPDLTADSTNNNLDQDTESRPYRCPICNRGFAVKAGVMQHMRTHTGERPYPCSVCGRAFKQKIQLTTHMRVHSGERPYGCKLCGKLFRQQSHVVQHLRTHTGEKPHKCVRCGKAFRQKYSLIAHQRRMCRNRQSHNPIAAGMTMWIGPSNIPGGATVKSLAPTGSLPPNSDDETDASNSQQPGIGVTSSLQHMSSLLSTGGVALNSSTKRDSSSIEDDVDHDDGTTDATNMAFHLSGDAAHLHQQLNALAATNPNIGKLIDFKTNGTSGDNILNNGNIVITDD